MNAAVANLDSVLLLNSAILQQAVDKHPKVSGQGVAYVDRCLQRLEAAKTLPAALVDGVNPGLLLPALSKGAASTDKGSKQAARDGVERRVSIPPTSSCITQPCLSYLGWLSVGLC